jgi:gas vesicle protein
MKQTTMTILSMLGGMVIGSALALAFTPKPGAEMRSLVRDLIEEEVEKMRSACHTGTAECDCDKK